MPLTGFGRRKRAAATSRADGEPKIRRRRGRVAGESIWGG